MADEGSHGERPRLWVPGLLYVTEEGQVTWGAHVGYNGRGPAFRYSPCGAMRAVDDWTHSAWLVPRKLVSAALVEEHAIVLPESLIDRREQPHAHRWLRAQRLVAVSGLKAERLVQAGIRLYQVDFNVAGDEMLTVEAAGGAEPPFALRASLRDLGGRETAATERGPLLSEPYAPSPIDRALRVISDGALDELGVVNALAARCLVEDGYGYRGAPAGTFVTMGEAQRKLRALDALFAQIIARAEAQRPQAEALRQALKRAPLDRRELSVPVYGTARAEPVAERRIALATGEHERGPRFERSGQPHSELVLPAERRWFVSGVSDWQPALPLELERRLAAELDRQGAKLGGWRLALLAVLAVALIGLSLYAALGR